MNSRRLKIVFLRIAVIIIGFSSFFFYVRFFELRSIADLFVFAAMIILLRLADSGNSSSHISFDSPFVIAAILLLPLPEAFLIILGSVLAANLITQEKVSMGAPIYQLAEKSLVIFASGLMLGGRYMTGQGESALNFFSIGSLSVIAICAVFFLFGLFIKELNISLVKATPFWSSFISRLYSQGFMFVALASIGVITALMNSSMGVYTLLLFTIPLLALRYSFKLLVEIKDTYRHTIAALSRAIEAEDPEQRSHSERVADLSTNIAKELGLIGERLEAVSYSALLHDIGRLGLDRDSFDSFLDTDEITDDEIPHALIGAEILEQVEFLAPFAPIVAKHHIPYSPNSRLTESEHPIESRIIAVADYFDNLTTNSDVASRLTPNQAVARIKKESFQFDPKVVRSLISVLRRQGKLISVR